MQKNAWRDSDALTKICSAMVPIICLYWGYDGLIRSFGLTISLAVVFLCLFVERKVMVYKPFLLFSLFYIGRRLISLLITGDFSASAISDFFLIVIVALSIIIISAYINKDILYKVWFVLGALVAGMVLYQAFVCYVLDQKVVPFIIGPLNDTSGNWSIGSYRPSACFPEPTVVVLFLAPLIARTLKKQKYLFAVIFSVVTLLTTSTNGIISIVILWGFYFLLKSDFSNFKKIMLSILLLVCSAILVNLPIFANTFSKLMHELTGSSSNLYVRMIFGYDTFKQMGLLGKIFGTGYNSVRDLRLNGGINLGSVTDTTLYSYLNSIQSVLIYSGVIGLILWIKTLISMYKDVEQEYKSFLILTIVLMFGTGTFYNVVSLLIYLFLISTMNENWILVKIKN